MILMLLIDFPSVFSMNLGQAAESRRNPSGTPAESRQPPGPLVEESYDIFSCVLMILVLLVDCPQVFFNDFDGRQKSFFKLRTRIRPSHCSLYVFV